MPNTPLNPQQIAEKRALKRLKSSGYAKMPSAEVLAAAAQVEQIRMQVLDKTDQTSIQRANLVANILVGYIEVMKERVEPSAPRYIEMVNEAIEFTIEMLKQGREIMKQRGKEFEFKDDPEEDDEEDSLGGGEETE